MYQDFDYPDHSFLNDQLLDYVKENISHVIYGGAKVTNFDLHLCDNFYVKQLLDWINSLIPEVAFNFSQQGEDTVDVKNSITYDLNAFSIASCWGIYYGKGDRVLTHNHFPYSISFVYCVSAPKGSSAFILEENKIKSIPGKIIFFPSVYYHGTKTNRSDGRCMITGNVCYNYSV